MEARMLSLSEFYRRRVASDLLPKLALGVIECIDSL